MNKHKCASNSRSSAVAITVAAAFTAVTGEASAMVINASSDIASGTYVSSASPVFGSFDISSLMSGYQIMSGSVMATFTDDSDAYQYQGTSHPTYNYSGAYSYSYIYNCGFPVYGECYGEHRDNYYSRDVTSYYTDPSETALLTVGGSTASGSSSYFSDPASYTGSATSWSWYENGYNIGYNIYTDYYYDQYSGYTGSFSATIALNGLALSDLNADGRLGFRIDAFSDFLVTGVTLTADLQPTGGGGAIPEPNAAALVTLGMGVLGLTSRWRRRRSRPT